MTWTVNNNLRNDLAEGADLDTALTGGSIEIYNASATLLVSCAIASVTTVNNVATVAFSSGTVESGISAQTGTNAKIFDSLSNELLSTNDVGTSGNDIVFDDNTGWNANDTIDVGDATITLTVTAT